MQNAHLPQWAHFHKPDWHQMRLQMSHLFHDPRFWAATILILLFLAMIVVAIIGQAEVNENVRPIYPTYPYYLP